MIDIGGGITRLEALLELLKTDHCVRVVVSLMDLNENHLESITDRVFDGQVNVQADSEVSRSASLQLFDPNYTLTLDRSNPMDGALYYDRMISVTYCVWQYGWSSSIDIPIFRGPITKINRDEVFVSLECMGKEIMGMGLLWATRNYAIGYNKTEYVRDLMSKGAGESRFDLQATTGKISKAASLAKDIIPWTEANRMANTMGQYLFYDGRGVLRMRSYPTVAALNFRSGDGGMLREKPKIVYDMDNFYNGVWVIGSSSSISYSEWAPASHPLNPNKMGRNGVPFRKPLIIEDSEITTSAAAATRGKSALTEALMQSIDVQAVALVNPLLEEGDMIEIERQGEYKIPIRVKSFSIPFIGPDMTLGQTKNVSIKARS